MTDIRANLNRRRDDLRPRLEAAHDTIHRTVIGSPEYEGHRQVIDEVAAIEATLATMQLADAQRAVAHAQHEVATAQQASNRRADAERSAREDETYWARKFMTNITIANGAGLAAAVLFMVKMDSPIVDPAVVQHATGNFFVGTVMGGGVPLLALLGTERPQRFISQTIERLPWARGLRHLFRFGVLMYAYAGLATFALMSGCFTAITAASNYYEGRAALSSPVSSQLPRDALSAKGSVPEPQATASALE